MEKENNKSELSNSEIIYLIKFPSYMTRFFYFYFFIYEKLVTWFFNSVF